MVNSTAEKSLTTDATDRHGSEGQSKIQNPKSKIDGGNLFGVHRIKAGIVIGDNLAITAPLSDEEALNLAQNLINRVNGPADMGICNWFTMPSGPTCAAKPSWRWNGWRTRSNGTLQTWTLNYCEAHKRSLNEDHRSEWEKLAS